MLSKKKKSSRPQEGKTNSDLANLLGLNIGPEEMAGLGIKSVGSDDDNDDDDDDESLLAELAALQGETRSAKKKKQKHDMQSDDDEDDGSNDDIENDAELLAELQCIAPGEDGSELEDHTPVLIPSSTTPDPIKQDSKVGILMEREKNYRQAIESASRSGEGSKARRYGRGLKEIEQMIKQAKAGKPIDIDTLPPPVSIAAPPSSTSAPVLPVQVDGSLNSIGDNATKLEKTSEEAESKVSQAAQPEGLGETKLSAAEKSKALELSTTRRNQYRMAALSYKRAGDISQAKQLLAVSKQIDVVMGLLEQDKDVDISQLPPAPSMLPSSDEILPGTKQSVLPGSPQSQSTPPLQVGGESEQAKNPEPPLPKDVSEALQQRFEKYQQAAEQAKKEGNSSKARRMGRIVKQYEDAIKCHKAGKPVAFDELPAPPGYAPIPGVAVPDDQPSSEPQSSETHEAPVAKSTNLSASTGSKLSQPNLQPATSMKKSPGRNEQQLSYLLERQKEFKMAALRSKRQGDLVGAKNHLRMGKGLEKMILSAQNGLRIDLSSVPPSPFAAASPAPTSELSFEMVQAEDCESTPRSPDEIQELFARLKDALIKQIEMCTTNTQHYQKLGDITNTKSFEKMATNLRHDLDAVQSAQKHQDPPPKFHYEDRSFTIINSFPDLSDSEVEIRIVRALNIPLPSGYQPKDMYTYVAYEFPFPNVDDPQTGRTQTVKHSINPGYDEIFKVNIDRKNRSLGRIFKRQPLKFEVKYERGFLKGDKPLGQVQMKLSPLDNKCEIHDCLDLMDIERGRKAVGGKVEIHLRIREPLLEKDVKIEKWKWLVIDIHLTTKKELVKVLPKPGEVTKEADLEEYVSLEVLKLEKQIAEKQVAAQKVRGEMPSPAIVQRCKQCHVKIVEIEKVLSSANRNDLMSYIRQLQSKIPQEYAKAQQAMKAGKKSDAQLCLTRKKLMDNEVATLKSQLGLH